MTNMLTRERIVTGKDKEKISEGACALAAPKRKVWIFDPDDCSEVFGMEFRLTYQGELFSTQPDDLSKHKQTKREIKHHIRRHFHRQLKHLWQTTPSLKTGEETSGYTFLVDGLIEYPKQDLESVAKRYSLYGFNFVPLVRSELKLMCGLDVLFLRPSIPGELYKGDLDNRVKTLLDALRIPTAGEEYSERTPEQDEKPFYCLLEDDKLITKLSVETDRLLDLPDIHEKTNAPFASLVITVRLRPYDPNFLNFHFA